MTNAQASQLVVLLIVALFLGFVVMRRIRPQPVRPDRLIRGAVIILVVVGIGLVGTGGGIISDPLALVLVPVFAVAGAALGYFLVRTMTFWTDQDTGTLWMRGGALFAAILVATIVLRFGVRFLLVGSLTSSSPATEHGFVYDLSADFLFLSLGLWAARAYFIYQRHRQHVGAAAG
jgi:hypothetical protein